MAAKGLDAHRKALKELHGKTVEAGWFETAKYPNGQTVAKVAHWNEFGTTRQTTNKEGKEVKIEHIPPRPFMRLARQSIAKKAPQFLADTTKKVMAGALGSEEALTQLGMFMENEIRKSIRDGGWQKNAPATVDRKGFDKPLVDTGFMLKSVSSAITTKS